MNKFITDMNWKVKVLAIGGAVGLLVGLAAALLYVRTIDQLQNKPQEAKLPAIQTSDALRILISLVVLVRTIAGLAESDKS